MIRRAGFTLGLLTAFYGFRRVLAYEQIASSTPNLLQADDCSSPNPVPLWGSIDAASPLRAEHFTSGGPNNLPFRRLTVFDGERRAELGKNDWRRSFAVYHEGDHIITEFDVRLPTNFPITLYAWQCIMQMKQSQPSNNGGVDSPRIELDCFAGNWRFRSDLAPDGGFWITPAILGEWIHVRWDVMYSQIATKGHAQLSIGAETSPVIYMPTLVPEIAGWSTAVPVGQSIPSHLRLGIYHNPKLPGTSVDIASVKVWRVAT